MMFNDDFSIECTDFHQKTINLMKNYEIIEKHEFYASKTTKNHQKTDFP